jgi:hypothetical protein
MIIISLLAGSVDAKTGEPSKDVDEMLPGSRLGSLALDAVAGRAHDATPARKFSVWFLSSAGVPLAKSAEHPSVSFVYRSLKLLILLA